MEEFFNNKIQHMCKPCNLVTGNFIRRADCASLFHNSAKINFIRC